MADAFNNLSDAASSIISFIGVKVIEVNDKDILEKKDMVTKLVSSIEPEVTIHDFRVVNGENNINLIFDLVVPRFYSEKDEKDLLMKVTESISKECHKCQCVITIEKGYIAE